MLGPSRETKDQQYQFLLDLAVKFQNMSYLALKAQYGGDNVFEENPQLKIATEIIKRNDAFSDDMACLGHTLDFEDAKPRAEDIPLAPEAEEGEDSSSVEQDLNSSRQFCDVHDELEDIVVKGDDISEPSSEAILPWLKEVYTNARGFELGTFDASILPIVWKKQTNKWEALALGYTSDVVTLMHSFTLSLLSNICNDRRLERAILGELLESLLERYRKGIAMTHFLLDVERKGTPLTANDTFNMNLQKR